MNQRKFRLSEEANREFTRREQETGEALELRRLQAVRLYGSGEDIAVVQDVSGASRRTIQRWVDSYEANGLAGLRPRWKGGNHRRLSEAQRAALIVQMHVHRPAELLKTEQRRERGEFWTVDDVRVLVEMRYGVTYRSVRSYHRLLQSCGLSYQRPEGIYRSRPSQPVIADFEADAEKK